MGRATFAVLCLTLVPAGRSYATPITYTFGTHLSIIAPGLSPTIPFGSAMTWTFTIDSAAVDLLPLDPFVGSYALGTSSWSIGPLSGTATGGAIQFSNRPPFQGDSITVDASGMVFDSAGGLTPTRIHLALQNPSGAAFNSTAPPFSLDIGFFTVTGLGLAFAGHPFLGDLSVLGPVEAATATPVATVPEPTSLLLLSCGFALCATALRRRRTRRIEYR